MNAVRQLHLCYFDFGLGRSLFSYFELFGIVAIWFLGGCRVGVYFVSFAHKLAWIVNASYVKHGIQWIVYENRVC